MRERKKDSRQKFLIGLAFEKANLELFLKPQCTFCKLSADKVNHYINSSFATAICKKAIELIESDVQEHDFYKIGSAVFNARNYEYQSSKRDQLFALFGQEYEKIRFHNIVRLGGDIIASGLSEYHKATVVGSIHFITKQYFNRDHTL
ncbi:hypothetical protein [Cysteiniphilum litorale]|uniref:hypothetical protein n=1 Tax=Cysteiniphilum litorale TaxID=2056700 RepID=UPI003F88255F